MCPCLPWRFKDFSLFREWSPESSSDIQASLSCVSCVETRIAPDTLNCFWSLNCMLLPLAPGLPFCNVAHTPLPPSVCPHCALPSVFPAAYYHFPLLWKHHLQRLSPRLQSWLCHLLAPALEEVIIPSLGAFVSFVKQGKISAHLTRLLLTLYKQMSEWVMSLSLSNSLQSHGLYPARLLCPWDSPGKNIGVGCHFLLQGIFLIQGSNTGLLHCRQILYHLSRQGSLYKHIHIMNLSCEETINYYDLLH